MLRAGLSALGASALVVGLLLAGCTTVPEQKVPVVSGGTQCPTMPECPKPVEPGKVEPSQPAAAPYRSAAWLDLPDWMTDDLTAAWPGFLASCRAMRVPEVKAAWTPVCAAAQTLPAKPNAAQIRAFFETHLTPWLAQNADGTTDGLITGYYEPLIRGSKWKSAKFSVPIYGVPDDLLVLDLAEAYPDLKNMRLRGRLEGRKVLPYWNRAQIEAKGERFPAKVLYWAADPVEFFFLQVQGSGQMELSDGSRVRLAYADQNGHAYKSIGRWLVDKGELRVDQASMQGIQAWVKANPQRLNELLNANPSFVFFREEVANGDGPKGSLGVPLPAARALAVDPRSIPLGAPVFLATTRPDGATLNRLMLAQDTGGAIRGRVRADFFWGFGPEAGAQAGKMRQQGKMWVLWAQRREHSGSAVVEGED